MEPSRRSWARESESSSGGLGPLLGLLVIAALAGGGYFAWKWLGSRAPIVAQNQVPPPVPPSTADAPPAQTPSVAAASAASLPSSPPVAASASPSASAIPLASTAAPTASPVASSPSSTAPSAVANATVVAPGPSPPPVPAGPAVSTQGELQKVVVTRPTNESALAVPHDGKPIIEVVDLRVTGGATTLELRRLYRRTTTTDSGLLGTMWRFDVETLLAVGDPIAVIDDADGLVDFLKETAGGKFASPSGEVLTPQPDGGYLRSRPDGSAELFDAAGKLVERRTTEGAKISLRYGKSGRLERIEGPFKAAIDLTVDDRGRLTKAVTSTGETVWFTYHGEPTPDGLPTTSPTIEYAYDSAGRLSDINDSTEGPTRLAYDAQHRAVELQRPESGTEKYEYLEAGAVVRHTAAGGGVTTTEVRSAEQRQTITDPLAHKTETIFDNAGRPVRITGPTGAAVQMTYDSRGRLVHSENDASKRAADLRYTGETSRVAEVLGFDGVKRTLTYDDAGRTVGIAGGMCGETRVEYRPDGLIARLINCRNDAVTYDYDEFGRRTTETDHLGRTTRYAYDAHGNLVKETDPAGRETKATYDEQGRMTACTRPDGTTTKYEYDSRGRLAKIVHPDGSETKNEYAPGQKRVIDPLGRAITFELGPDGRLRRIEGAVKSAAQAEYDTAGNLTRSVNALGGETRSEYDVLGRLTSRTASSGGVRRYEYTPAGQLAKLVDEAGGETKYEYDSKARLIREVDPLGTATTYAYSSTDKLVRLSRDGRATVEFDYDARDNLIAVREGERSLVAYAYNAADQVTRAIEGGEQETSYRYDEAGRLTSWQSNARAGGKLEYDAADRMTTIDNAAGSTKYEYDAVGRVVGVTDPLGQTRKRKFDAAGQLVEAVAANGDRAAYEFDAAGNVAAVEHPGGGRSEYAYDAAGNTLKAVRPDGSAAANEYDKAGRLIRRTNARGQATTLSYDAAGRLVEKRDHQGKTTRFRYDVVGNLLEADDGAFPIRRAYDAAGRLTQIEYPALKRKLEYRYDNRSRLTAMVDSEGRTISYGYDEQNRLARVRVGDGAAIVMGYDASGRRTSITYPNGVRGTWTYDPFGRVASLKYVDRDGKTTAGWTHEYDAVGNCVKTIESVGRVLSYRYDPAGQLLAEAVEGGATVAYEYHPGGNRSRRIENEQSLDYRYDKADRLVAAGDEKFTYDADGNLIERSAAGKTMRYEFDADDRLVKITLPDGKEIAYGYAPTGERVSRRDAAGTTYFVNNGTDVVAELDGEFRATATYLHGTGIDDILAVTKNGSDLYYHLDRLGSVAAMSDTPGAVTAQYRYDAFGRRSQLAGDAQDRHGFTGRQWEVDDVYFFRARFYDARLGRFLSRDSVAADPLNPLTLNPYRYALNNPLRYVDPLGADEFDPFAAANQGGVMRMNLADFSPGQPPPAPPAGWPQRVWEPDPPGRIDDPYNLLNQPRGRGVGPPTIPPARNPSPNPAPNPGNTQPLDAPAKGPTTKPLRPLKGEDTLANRPVPEGNTRPVNRPPANNGAPGDGIELFDGPAAPAGGGKLQRAANALEKLAKSDGLKTAGGTLGVAGIGLGVVEAYSCYAEGGGLARCGAEVAIGTVSAVVGGVVAGGIIAATGGLAAPVFVALGALGAAAGTEHAFTRLGAAPGVAADRDLATRQAENAPNLNKFLNAEKNKINSRLGDLKKRAADAQTKFDKAGQRLRSAAEKGEGVLLRLKDAVDKLPEAVNKCEDVEALKTDAKKYADMAERNADLVEQAIDRAEALAASGSPDDDAKIKDLLQAAQGLTTGIAGEAQKAQQAGDKIDDIANVNKLARKARDDVLADVVDAQKQFDIAKAASQDALEAMTESVSLSQFRAEAQQLHRSLNALSGVFNTSDPDVFREFDALHKLIDISEPPVFSTQSFGNRPLDIPVKPSDTKLLTDKLDRLIFCDDDSAKDAVDRGQQALTRAIQKLTGASKLQEKFRPKIRVPSVIGLPVGSAIGELSVIGLGALPGKSQKKPDSVKAGVVFGQDPMPGAEVEWGTNVIILYGDDDKTKQKTVQVPRLLSLTRDAAEKKLSEVQLRGKPKAGDRTPTRANVKQEVYSQSPAEGTEVFVGAMVGFEYYAGLKVGDYTKLLKDEATAKITKDGFKPNVHEGDRQTENPSEEFLVYDQSPKKDEYRWFDDPVEAFFYRFEEGFRPGDGGRQGLKFSDAVVSNGRMKIQYDAGAKGGNETQGRVSWSIERFPDAGAARAFFSKVADPLRKPPPSSQYYQVTDIGGGGDSAWLTTEVKTDRNQGTFHTRVQLYRGRFVIVYGKILPQAGGDVSDSPQVIRNSQDLVRERFPRS